MLRTLLYAADGSEALPAARVLLEEYARDSFENLLFSLARFRGALGRYPARVTLVSWGFKAERLRLHARALRMPSARIAILSPPAEPVMPPAALAGEARTVAAFRKDMYGAGAELSGKRARRNPFRRTAPYALVCAGDQDMMALLHAAVAGAGTVPEDDVLEAPLALWSDT